MLDVGAKICTCISCIVLKELWMKNYIDMAAIVPGGDRTWSKRGHMVLVLLLCCGKKLPVILAGGLLFSPTGMRRNIR